MSTDKNFSTSENNDPQPPVEKQSASSNNPENSQQEPKYTQLYGLEGADGKISLDPQASPGFQGAEGKEEPHKRISQQFDIDPNTREPLLIAQAIKNILPALGNEFITIIKDSSLLSAIGVMELWNGATTVSTTTYLPLTPLLFAAFYYLIMTSILTLALKAFENRMGQGDKK